MVKNGQFRETGNMGHKTLNGDKHNKTQHNTEHLKDEQLGTHTKYGIIPGASER